MFSNLITRCSTKNVMNNKTTNIKSQQKESKRFDIKSEFDSNLNLSDLTLLKYFLQQQSIHKQLFYSHRYLAQVTKLSYSTVKRSIRRLEKLGYLLSVKRPYKSCLYFLDEMFSIPHIKEQVKKYFKIGFLMSLLFSYYTHQAKSERVIILKDNISNCDSVTNVQKTIKPKKLLWEFQDKWREFQYGGERPPTKRLSFDEDLMLLHRDVPMDYVRKQNKEKNMEFTQEELSQLSQFSKQTLEYAKEIVRKDEQQGKQISNPFKYFFAICERHQQRNPTTGKRYAPKESTPPPSPVAWKASTLAQDQYDRKVRIYNRQVKLYNAGYEYRNLEYGELYAMCNDQIPRRPLPVGTPPPQEPPLQEGTPLYWEEKGVTKPHALEVTTILPVSGNSIKTATHPIIDSIFPPENPKDFYEQYTPNVDAMYENYEEILD
jgi:DNA-binding MarR family transcriptional regulator